MATRAPGWRVCVQRRSRQSDPVVLSCDPLLKLQSPLLVGARSIITNSNSRSATPTRTLLPSSPTGQPSTGASQRQQPRHQHHADDQNNQRERHADPDEVAEGVVSGATTSVFTGDDTGVMNAVEAASATIIANG